MSKLEYLIRLVTLLFNVIVMVGLACLAVTIVGPNHPVVAGWIVTLNLVGGALATMLVFNN